MTTTARTQANPYVGPRSFGRGDVLYGRDREVADLLDLLIAERVVLLHSPSGAGKTSLIQARLIALLTDEGFEVLPVIRLSHEVPASLVSLDPPVNRYVLSALVSLEEGLPSHLQRPIEELARTSLADYIADWPDLDNRPGNEVLILDQFEEVITADQVDHDAKAAFFQDLGASIRDRSIWALFSMREDFVGELALYMRYVPTRLATRFRLDLLTVDQALDAVICPARDAHAEFDERAAVKLVDDLRRVRTQRGTEVVEELGRHVEPVQLQVTCRQIWQGLGDGNRITLDDIESAGDVNDALAGYYAASVTAVSLETGVSERALRDWFERELVTAQGFRGQVLGGPEASGGDDGRVLELLTAAHLLRAESHRGATWYELAHDRLTQPIAEDNARWRAEHLSDVERRAIEWDRQGRPDWLLVSRFDLDQAERWISEPTSAPTRVEHDFVSASGKAQRQRDDLVREAGRTRRWLRISIGLLAVALITAVVAVVFASTASHENAQAHRATDEARQRALVGAGLGEISFDSQLSILLTLRALKLEPPAASASSWEAANAVQTALTDSPVVQRLGDPGSDDVAAGWSREGDEAVTADGEGTVRVVNATTGAVVAERENVGDVAAVAMSASHRGLVAIGLQDGAVKLWDAAQNAAPVEAPGHKGSVSDVAFSPHGRLLASAGADNRVLVSRGRNLVRSIRTRTTVKALSWSANGKLLYSADQSGSVSVLNPVAGSEPLARYPSRNSDTGSVVQFSNDGTMLAKGTSAGETVISRTDGRGQPVVANPVSGEVTSLSFTSDNAHLLVLNQYGDVMVENTRTGAVLRSFKHGSGQTPTAVVGNPSSPGRALVVGGHFTTAVWNTEVGHGENLVVDLEHMNDGRAVTTSYGSDTVLFWSEDGQRLINRRRISGASFWKAAVDPHGRFLAYVNLDGTAAVAPLGRHGQSRSLGTAITAVAVSTSGRLVATGGTEIHIWDRRSGREVTVPVPNGSTDYIAALDFGRDDQLVSESRLGNVTIWDRAHGHWRAQRTIPAKGDPVTAVARSTNGEVAIGHKSGLVQLVDPSSADDEQALEWHTSPVNDVAFDASGDRLVSVSDDGFAAIWDVRTAEMFRAIRQSGVVYRASFSPDGRYLLTTGYDGLAYPGTPVTIWLKYAELRDAAYARLTRAPALTATECGRDLPSDAECRS